MPLHFYVTLSNKYIGIVMATLQQIRENVSRKLQDPDNTSRSAATVDLEINRSVRYYQNYRYWFNEELITISLVAGQKTVPNIPTDLLSELYVNGLMLIDSQVKINLLKLAPNDFAQRDQDQTGRPYYYTYKDDTYLLLPVPQIAYDLELRYLKAPTLLVNDSDTNIFTVNAEDLIMLHTLKNIYSEDKQDIELGSYYGNLEAIELKTIEERTNNRNASGYLQSHSILETYNT